MDASAAVEKKLGLSLDELIAQQKAKQSQRKPSGGAGGKKKAGARVQKVQTKGGGRVLVVPRPKHVPRPSSGRQQQAAALKATRGGGVHKGGPAPKFVGGGGKPGAAASRNVKVTIGNKLSGRPASHIPTSGVLSKPFMGAAAAGSGRGSGRAPMHVESLPSGAPLSSRFDTLHGVAPSGPARPTGVPRRNAHGVVLP